MISTILLFKSFNLLSMVGANGSGMMIPLAREVAKQSAYFIDSIALGVVLATA